MLVRVGFAKEELISFTGMKLVFLTNCFRNKFHDVLERNHMISANYFENCSNLSEDYHIAYGVLSWIRLK